MSLTNDWVTSGAIRPRVGRVVSVTILLVVTSGTAAPIVGLLAQGAWSRFYADDYSTAVRLATLGFAGAWLDQVSSLNGRFSGFFLSNLLMLAGPRFSVIGTFVALVGLVAAARLCLGATGWSGALAATGVVSALALATAAPEEVYLWASGIGMVAASLALAVAAVGCARHASTSPRWLAPAALGAFLAGGAYEATAVVLVVAGVGMAAGLCVGRLRRAALAALGVAAGSGFALLIMALLPGTPARRSALPAGMDNVAAVRFGIEQGLMYVQDEVLTWPMALATLAGALGAVGRAAVSRPWVLLPFVWTTAVVSVCSVFALTAKTLGAAPPERTQTAAMAVILAAAVASGLMIRLPSRLVPVAMSAVALLAAVPSSDQLAKVMERHAAAARWDRREEQIRAARPGAVQVEQLPGPGSVTDLIDDPTFWVNGAAASYYGVESITALPAAG